MGFPLVLGAEGGGWSGYTADVAGAPAHPPQEQKSQDRWAGGANRVSWSPDYTNPPGFSDPGRHAGYDSNVLPGTPPNRRLDVRGRVVNTPAWPAGGLMSRPMGDRHYDVQAWTGNSYSTVPTGGWARGKTARFMAPQFRPAKPPIMYDPTDPDTWNVVRAYN